MAYAYGCGPRHHTTVPSPTPPPSPGVTLALALSRCRRCRWSLPRLSSIRRRHQPQCYLGSCQAVAHRRWSQPVRGLSGTSCHPACRPRCKGCACTQTLRCSSRRCRSRWARRRSSPLSVPGSIHRRSTQRHRRRDKRPRGLGASQWSLVGALHASVVGRPYDKSFGARAAPLPLGVVGSRIEAVLNRVP